MVERYTRVFTLDSKQYQAGAPVIIMAGALLKDNSDDSIIAQLKFKSIVDNGIKALTAAIQSISVSGEKLGTEIDYQYLDLSVERDDEFGQKVPIRLTDNTARKFTVRIVEVIFKDDSKWRANTFELETIINPDSLTEVFNNDLDLIEQFKLEYGRQSIVMPQLHDSYWICSCGSFNRNDEEVCHKCGNEKSILINLDIEGLEERKELRVKEDSYNEAIKLAQENNLDSIVQAVTILESLSGWKDCDEKREELLEKLDSIKDINYQAAIELSMKDSVESLVKAKEIMEKLSGWKDSDQKAEEYTYRINRLKYDEAVALSKKDTVQSLANAGNIMASLNGWMDSKEKVAEFGDRIKELKKNLENQQNVSTPQDVVPEKKKPNKIVLAIAAAVALVLLVFGISKLAVSSQTIPVNGLVADVDGELKLFTVQEVRFIDWDITGNLVVYSNDTISLDAEVLDENGKVIQSEHIEKASMIKDGSDYYDEEFTMIKYKLKKDGREVGSIVKYVPNNDGDPFYLVTTRGTYGFSFV